MFVRKLYEIIYTRVMYIKGKIIFYGESALVRLIFHFFQIAALTFFASFSSSKMTSVKPHSDMSM